MREKGNLIRPCVTRWVEKGVSLKNFKENIQSIAQPLECIKTKHLDAETTSLTCRLKIDLEDSRFIMHIVIMEFYID